MWILCIARYIASGFIFIRDIYSFHYVSVEGLTAVRLAQLDRLNSLENAEMCRTCSLIKNPFGHFKMRKCMSKPNTEKGGRSGLYVVVMERGIEYGIVLPSTICQVGQGILIPSCSDGLRPGG